MLTFLSWRESWWPQKGPGASAGTVGMVCRWWESECCQEALAQQRGEVGGGDKETLLCIFLLPFGLKREKTQDFM